MGYGRGRLLWQVELPLALPAIMAGLRVATVSTVALITVGVIVGYGGLGQLIFARLQQQLLPAEILTGLAAAASLLGARPRPAARRRRPAAHAVDAGARA